jgi:excinuclease UvrABC helicase subunit UvrB
VSRKSGGELALKFNFQTYFQPKTLQKTIKDLFEPSNNPKTTQNYKKKKNKNQMNSKIQMKLNLPFLQFLKGKNTSNKTPLEKRNPLTQRFFFYGRIVIN